MTKTALIGLSIGLSVAIFIGVWTIFFTPGSTITDTQTREGEFTTQSVHSSAPGSYIPFDPHYGLEGRQRSLGRSEKLP